MTVRLRSGETFPGFLAMEFHVAFLRFNFQWLPMISVCSIFPVYNLLESMGGFVFVGISMCGWLVGVVYLYVVVLCGHS